MSMYFFIFIMICIAVKIAIYMYRTHMEFKYFESSMKAKHKAQNDRIAKKIAEAIFEEAKTNGRLKELIDKIKNQSK